MNNKIILLNKGKLIAANMIRDIYTTQNNNLNYIDDIKIIKKKYQILKEQIIKIYDTLSKRIVLIYDDNKVISSIDINKEAYKNYKIIIEDYEKLFNETYNEKKAIIINFRENTIQKLYPKANEIDDINSIENKKIVKKLNKNM